MIEWILSSSILIAAIILLRLIFKKHISAGMRYALWGLVLLRLLVPVNFFQTVFSVENLTVKVSEQPRIQAITQELTTPQQSYEVVYQQVVQEQLPELEAIHETLPAQQQAQIEAAVEEKLVQSTPLYSLKRLALTIWIFGGALVLAFLFAINWSFSTQLRRTRQRMEADTPVPVYCSRIAETPCLFGFFRPAIYITSETAGNKAILGHILAHEATHFRHKDHIWATLRCLCLALHWYNPLVWVCLSLSRRDCELACDEATLRRIGDDQRIDYGKTLLEMTCVKRASSAALLTATTMLSDKKAVTERIRQVVKQPRVLITAVIAVILIAAVVVGCTFTGTPETPEATDPPVEITMPTETTTPLSEDPFANSQWEYNANTDPAETIRSALENLGAKHSFRSIAIQSITYDAALTEQNLNLALTLADTTRAAELNLTKETIPTFFRIYNAIVMIESNDTAYPTDTYCFPFMTIKSEKDSLYYILDTLMPYSVLPPSTWQPIPYTTYGWIHEPQSTAEAAVRQALANEVQENYILAVNILSVSYDPELTRVNIDSLKGSDLAKSAGLTDEDLENRYQIVQATWRYVCDPFVPNPYFTTATYKGHFSLVQDSDTGLWRIWENLTPYGTEDPGRTPGSFTQEDITAFTHLLTQRGSSNGTGAVNYYNRLLAAAFESPGDVDLTRMFYDQNIDEAAPLTEVEKNFLAQQNQIDLNLSVVRISTKRLEEVLRQHLGITLADTRGMDDTQFVYFPDTDCWYHSMGDAGIVQLAVTGGQWLEDNMVEVYYNNLQQDMVVTLRWTSTGYTVLSNLPRT